MKHDRATADAFFNLHVINSKAMAALACIIECSVPLPRAETLVIIAEDYLLALDEAIEQLEADVA